MRRRPLDANMLERRPSEAVYAPAKHGSLPAQAMRREKTEIDEMDACELGCHAALEQLRRERAAEDWS